MHFERVRLYNGKDVFYALMSQAPELLQSRLICHCVKAVSCATHTQIIEVGYMDIVLALSRRFDCCP